jgi:transcriptional repressor NrdR
VQSIALLFCIPHSAFRIAPMKCPFCKSPDTQVIDSRVSDDGESIRRRRKCTSCSKRFTTYETIELRMPQVVKQDGTRSEFDLQKLRTGFMRALHKRPVPTQLVDDAIATITQDVLALGEREIASRRLGEMVMRELKRLDQVAYIRFASVYRSFQGVDDFQDAIKEVQRPTAKPATSKTGNARDAKETKDAKEVEQDLFSAKDAKDPNA